jgi:hypothetical protein
MRAASGVLDAPARRKFSARRVFSAPQFRCHCVITLQSGSSGTHPTPAQQCWPLGHDPLTVVQTPVLQAGREQVVVPPPLIACGVKPPAVVTTAQSVSWQHCAQVPVVAQQSGAVVSLHCLFEQQSWHLPVFGQHDWPWLHDTFEYWQLPLLQATV